MNKLSGGATGRFRQNYTTCVLLQTPRLVRFNAKGVSMSHILFTKNNNIRILASEILNGSYIRDAEPLILFFDVCGAVKNYSSCIANLSSTKTEFARNHGALFRRIKPAARYH